MWAIYPEMWGFLEAGMTCFPLAVCARTGASRGIVERWKEEAVLRKAAVYYDLSFLCFDEVCSSQWCYKYSGRWYTSTQVCQLFLWIYDPSALPSSLPPPPPHTHTPPIRAAQLLWALIRIRHSLAKTRKRKSHRQVYLFLSQLTKVILFKGLKTALNIPDGDAEEDVKSLLNMDGVNSWAMR